MDRLINVAQELITGTVAHRFHFHWRTKEFVVGKIRLPKTVPGPILMLLLPLSIVYLIYSKIILRRYITASAVVYSYTFKDVKH